MATTTAQVTQLVNKLAADLAPAVMAASTLLPIIPIQYAGTTDLATTYPVSRVSAAGAFVANAATNSGYEINSAGATSRSDWSTTAPNGSAAAPVARLLSDATLYADYLKRLAIQSAGLIDTNVLNMATGFTTNTALGANATPITEASMETSYSVLAKATNAAEKLYFACTIANFQVLTKLSTLPSAAQAGAYLNSKLASIKGLSLRPSSFVSVTGLPLKQNNLAFAPSALHFLHGTPSITYGSPVTAISSSGGLSLAVWANNDGTDTPAVSVALNFQVLIINNSYGQLIYS